MQETCPVFNDYHEKKVSVVQHIHQLMNVTNSFSMNYKFEFAYKWRFNCMILLGKYMKKNLEYDESNTFIYSDIKHHLPLKFFLWKRSWNLLVKLNCLPVSKNISFIILFYNYKLTSFHMTSLQSREKWIWISKNCLDNFFDSIYLL